jgi:hypothetical protein
MNNNGAIHSLQISNRWCSFPCWYATIKWFFFGLVVFKVKCIAHYRSRGWSIFELGDFSTNNRCRLIWQRWSASCPCKSVSISLIHDSKNMNWAKVLFLKVVYWVTPDCGYASSNRWQGWQGQEWSLQGCGAGRKNDCRTCINIIVKHRKHCQGCANN